MKTNILALGAALSLVAVQAFAAAHGAKVEDSDGDGSYSMEEIKAVYPDLTEEAFAAVDTDGSGDVSEEEMTAAMESGALAQ